ncbi:Probable methyltransferase PMT2 [Linum perenne]
MGARGNSWELKARRYITISIVVAICFAFYLLGSSQKRADEITKGVMNQKKIECAVIQNLNYTVSSEAGLDDAKEIPPCDDVYVDYTPCQDQTKERHCPADSEKLHCLVPAPKGYVTPFPWPESRDYVPYANVAYKAEKDVEKLIIREGNVLRIPDGGLQAYVEQLSSVIPLDDGLIRTALDTGCGVGSLSAYLFEKNVVTMSFAPRDSDEAQVQIALERGVPAVIGVLETIKLPFPSGAFDMVHCSSCLIPWGANDGMYMMEVDRVLRPGGYWLLSGYGSRNRTKEVLEAERNRIEDIAKLLCWEKKTELSDTAIWQKRLDLDSCTEQHPTTCESSNPNDIWYKKMEPCVTPSNGSEWKPYPKRLNITVPSRISSGSIPGVYPKHYMEDSKIWKKHVNASYRRENKILDTGRYRNVMDMNAGLGGFAAALESPNLWVMNVMPTIAEKDTLGIIYERGLIGIYHDWCEAFSTYPRSYDLIHANGLFSLYKDKCSMEDILLEMDRILRPEGTVIIRDEQNVLINVKKIVSGMRWTTKMFDHEDGPMIQEKVMFAVKQYWSVGEQSTNYTS